MPTGKQDKDFSELMSEQVDTITVSTSALDIAIEFICDHLEPGDVFGTKQLESWAETNGYTKE